MNIQGARAIVTGAASGIGRGTALELARRGADVILTDHNTVDLEPVADAIRAMGRVAECRGFDVADLKGWETLRGDLGPRGVQILVNNAGVALTGPFVECSIEDLHWQLDINLRGVMYGCHTLLPVLLAQSDAHIVNLSSLFGIISVPDNVAYCMSKHAVKALTECLMVELPRHVRLTSVHPGAVATRIVTSGRYRKGGGMSSEGAAKLIANGVAPEEAGRRIANAIERQQERLVIGNDAKLLSALRWLIPQHHRSLLRLYYGRQRAR